MQRQSIVALVVDGQNLLTDGPMFVLTEIAHERYVPLLGINALVALTHRNLNAVYLEGQRQTANGYVRVFVLKNVRAVVEVLQESGRGFRNRH